MTVAFKTWSAAFRFALSLTDDVKDADVRGRVRSWLQLKMFRLRDEGHLPPTSVSVRNLVAYMVKSMSFRMGIKV